MEGTYIMSDASETPQPDTEAHLLELGRVANAWAHLEFLMDTLIWDLAEVQQMLGACITVQMMGSGNRLRALMSLLLLREAPKEIVDRLERFTSSNHGMQQKRNRIVHDTWVYNPARKEAFQVRVALEGRDLSFKFAETPIEDIQKVKEKIDDHVKRFILIRADILAWLPTSSNKWRGQLQKILFFPPGTRPENIET
jgi:hypothetical protein